MKQTKKNAATLLYFFLLILICVTAIQAISGRVNSPAFAAYSDYTGVLEDLSADGNFDADEYKDNANDHTVQVVQVAESTGGGLFIYTYQPCQRTRYLIATSVNMSLSESVDNTQTYGLELLGINGVLGKYKVQGLQVSKLPVRYYNISSIYRAYDKRVDAPPAGGNTVTEVAHPVGQLWTVQSVDGRVYYSVRDLEVIQVSAQTVGFRRYANGINPLILSGSACDAHFLAFSTRREIDALKSADLEYKTQPYEISKGVTTFGSKTNHRLTLWHDEYAENPAGGWFGKKAKWDRMASTDEFLNCGLEFKSEEREMFSAYDWVLNFTETDYDAKKNGFGLFIPVMSTLFTGDVSHMYEISGTRVSEVTLLRLEFEHAGKIYNLGVVSDKQTGANNPTNGGGFTISDVPWWVWLIVVTVVIIVLLILSIIFPNFGAFMLWLLKKLWLIISFPFRMLGKGIKAISERRAAAKAKPKAKPAKRKTAKKPKTKSKATKKGGKK